MKGHCHIMPVQGPARPTAKHESPPRIGALTLAYFRGTKLAGSERNAKAQQNSIFNCHYY